MRIAIFGHGNVGGALARRLSEAGYQVVIAAKPNPADDRQTALAPIPIEEPQVAFTEAEVVLLAIPFPAISDALPPYADLLAHKVVVDCTNPVSPQLSHGLKSESSGSAIVQDLLPQSRVVKAFSIYGYENLQNNDFGWAKPAMLFCGDDAPAKDTVSNLISDLGWEPVDVGPLSQALHLEHLTLLWIQMARVHGSSVNTVWARLTK